MGALLAAVIAFVGTHELLSHPLRPSLVSALGEKGFLAVYSLIAFGTGGWAVWAFMNSPTEMLWNAPMLFWQLAAPVMFVACVLLAGSLLDPNPALPGAERRLASTPEPRGVLCITRHPMMWSFALWAIVHILVAGTARSAILGAGILFLALFGAAMQDRKKRGLLGNGWTAWQARTAFVPFAAQIGRRLPAHTAWPGWRSTIGGLLIFIGAIWAHRYLGTPAIVGWAV